jgi:glutaconate CoA-transferase subunit B
MTETNSVNLVELLITAASECWRGEGEILATVIGLIPCLAASLSMSTNNPAMMMTDSEAYIVSEPVPVGKRNGYEPKRETWMGFSRIFDNVWSGKRHALVAPNQIDSFGQTNISCISGTYEKPQTQILGVRGYPGNSISHRNSFFVPVHSKQVFVANEVDMVCSIGYNPARLPKGYNLDDIKIGRIITNLCVMDFEGPNKQVRVISLHPGVRLEQVRENTGFELAVIDNLGETQAPTTEQIEIIERLDPSNLRATALR